jgi:hypothetical protein
MISRPIRRAVIVSAMLAMMMALHFAALPSAVDAQTVTITQEVTCEDGQAEIGLAVTQAPAGLQFSSAAQTSSAALQLTAGMVSGCSNDGWKVTLVASNLVATGVGNISASNVRAVSIGTVTRVSGQNKLPLPGTVSNTPLNTPVIVMQAMPSTGKGVYSESIGLTLLIPGSSLPGTYTTTLTATISVGPT